MGHSYGVELDLDKIPCYSKLEIAKHQLEQAIQLFCEKEDYICAITLAGASEEILGKLLEAEGKEHSLGSFVSACIKYGKLFYGENWKSADFFSQANYFRDGLKHITDGEPISVSREAAIQIIDRAIENFTNLTGQESTAILDYTTIKHA